jgi:type IV secretory pathway TraG/TraD family ATPase VirD4
MRSDEQIVLVRGKPALRCGRAIYFRRSEMLDGLGTSRLRAGAAPTLSTPGQQLVFDEQADRLAVVTAAGTKVGLAVVAVDRDQPDDDLEAFAMLTPARD